MLQCLKVSFEEWNELLKNFEENVDKFHKFVQEKFVFKYFADDVSLEELILLLVQSRIIKNIRKKLSAIYSNQIEQATTKHLRKHSVQNDETFVFK